MTPTILHGLPTTVIDAGAPAEAPLLVAMHGIGSNEHDLVPAYRAFERQAVLAFPRSPLDHPPGFAWYRLIRVGVPEPASFEQGQETLGAWLRARGAMPGNADRPLILSGFSQGAIMALSYAMTHPDEVGGVMAFSGYVPDFVSPIEAKPRAGEPGPLFFLTLGRNDPLFPFSRLEETARRLEAAGWATTAVATDAGHHIPPEAVHAAAAWLAERFPAGGAGASTAAI